jgi:hypothetical protein
LGPVVVVVRVVRVVVMQVKKTIVYTLPEELPPTIQGTLIQCNYALVIALSLVWLLSEKPTVELPISIFNKNPYYQATSNDAQDTDQDCDLDW